MWQASHNDGKTHLKIADVQCESGESSFGQVIETFKLVNGVWVSKGLASGPDVSFRTTGECVDDLVNTLSCPAQTLSEDGKQLDGFLVITIGAENTTWQFGLKA